MRRIAIVAALLGAGCEEFEVGPEIATDLIELDILIPDDLAEDEGAPIGSVFYFEDPDGDIVGGAGVVYPKSGDPVMYEECQIGVPEEGEDPVTCTFAVTQDFFANSIAGITEGVMQSGFGVDPVPADYVVEMWLVDARGFESNRISATVHLVAE